LGEFFIEFGFNIILKKSNNKVIKNTRNYKYVRLAVHVNGVISEIIRAKEFGFHNFNQNVYSKPIFIRRGFFVAGNGKSGKFNLIRMPIN